MSGELKSLLAIEVSGEPASSDAHKRTDVAQGADQELCSVQITLSPANHVKVPVQEQEVEAEPSKHAGLRQKQVPGRPFKPGQSGNPKGRPKGALGWKARAAKAILADDISEIMRVAIEMAKNGDPDMIKLCLALGIPRGEEPVSVEIPTLKTPDDCRVAIGRVVEETLAGEITPGEGKRLVELIERRRTSFEVLDLERQFDYARGRAMFFELLIRNPVGKSRAQDLKAIYRFNADVQKQNLPQRIHEQVLFNYYDHVLEKGKVASTPEGLVHEIEEFLGYMEVRAGSIKCLGPEGHRD
jgi:hypothetical protein